MSIFGDLDYAFRDDFCVVCTPYIACILVWYIGSNMTEFLHRSHRRASFTKGRMDSFWVIHNLILLQNNAVLTLWIGFFVPRRLNFCQISSTRCHGQTMVRTILISNVITICETDHMNQWPGTADMHAQTRADSRLAPSQWETSLQSNTVSLWLGTSLLTDWTTVTLVSRGSNVI